MTDAASIIKVAAADGTELAVALHPPKGEGPLVLLVHGIASHMGWYRPLAASLAEAGCAVVVPDRRGSGISGGPRGHMDRAETLLDDLHCVLAEAQSRFPGRKVHAIGLSLGGVLVTAAEIRRPRTFDSLILFAPGFKPAAKIPLWRRLRVLRRSFTHPTKLYDLPFGVDELTQRPEWRRSLAEDPLRTSRVSARFLVQLFALQRRCWSARSRLLAPCYCLLAENDAVVDNARCLQLLAESGSVKTQIEIVDGASHLVPAAIPRPVLLESLLHWMRGERLSETRTVISRDFRNVLDSELPAPPDLKSPATPKMGNKAPTNVLERREQILAPLDPARYTSLRRLVTDAEKRFVVSFGGGSVPGLCGNAALARLLEELGLRSAIHEVWGTSAGAAVGGPWATGSEALEILASMKSLDRKGSVDLSWTRLALSLLMKPFGARLPDGLIRGRHFTDAVAAVLKVQNIEDCVTPFRCIACTDDGESRRKVFRRGPILPAIRSSMSIPGIVIPRERLESEDSGYYDGGLVEKTPLISPISEHQRRADGRRLFLLATHFGNDARRTPAKGFILRFLQSIYALEALAWDYQLAEARSKPGVILMILNPHIEDPSLFDFSRVERNYLQAREVFSDLLQNAKLGLALGLE